MALFNFECVCMLFIVDCLATSDDIIEPQNKISMWM